MTLILAAQGPDGTYIGSDSRGSSYYYYSENRDRKLAHIGNFWVGCAGSYRVTQLLEFNAKRFKPVKRRSDVFRFVQTYKKLMESNKHDLDKHDADVMLAARCGIYVVYSTYQFNEHERWGIGSGDMYGMGFYDASTIKDTKKRIQAAIGATAGIVNSVGGRSVIRRVRR